MQDLLGFLNASPSPYHCAQVAEARVGGEILHPEERWTLRPGHLYSVAHGGSFVAWRMGTLPPAEAGFRLVGAHTDSPNLRVKPVADRVGHGCAQLGVEVYGGALLYTWLDRDLGLAGRVSLRDDREVLLDCRRPILRIPSLAIHLHREVNKKGLKVDAQKHLAPLWALGEAPCFRGFLGDALDADPADILAWDLMLVDTLPACVGGLRGEFLFAARLDNQAMCHAAVAALLQAPPCGATQVVCLYDHEEVGSGSSSGAAGAWLPHILRRVAGDEGDAFPRAIARSLQASADMAHALHPNYADMHEPEHRPLLNQGPVLKFNAQQRYATAARTAARFQECCEAVGAPVQRFVVRSDLPCGSTIGPLAAAQLGVATVDVGNPMLSMHSIREQAGTRDHAWMQQALAAFLALTPERSAAGCGP
jgi:aspartyl aminopeptidase